MSEEVKLLSRTTNNAVVHLPGRRFPGVVMQGDTMDGMIKQMERTLDLMNDRKIDEAIECMEYIKNRFDVFRSEYESTCANAGISLPYPKSDGI